VSRIARKHAAVSERSAEVRPSAVCDPGDERREPVVAAQADAGSADTRKRLEPEALDAATETSPDGAVIATAGTDAEALAEARLAVMPRGAR